MHSASDLSNPRTYDDALQVIYELRTRNEELERLLGSEWLAPRCLRLTRSENRILGLLVSRPGSCFAYRAVYDLLYGLHLDPPDDEVVKTFACKIRSKLRPFGVAIETEWGFGYRITPENLARLEALYAPGERPTNEVAA